MMKFESTGILNKTTDAYSGTEKQMKFEAQVVKQEVEFGGV